MRVEISIAREKAKTLPKGSLVALIKRLSPRYEHVEVSVKAACNDGLSVQRAKERRLCSRSGSAAGNMGNRRRLAS